MATERISDRQIDYPTTRKSFVKAFRKIRANQYYIYSAIILVALTGVAFLIRGVV